MTLYDYQKSKEIDAPFYALIMAAMRKADSNNIEKLKSAFPELFAELQERYNAPCGIIDGDES
jgi:hypothetical protein